MPILFKIKNIFELKKTNKNTPCNFIRKKERSTFVIMATIHNYFFITN